MAFTKQIGVRFETEVLDELKSLHGIDSPQKALRFLEQFWKNRGETPPSMADHLLPGNLGTVNVAGEGPQPITQAFMSRNGSVTLTIGPGADTRLKEVRRGFREYLELLKGTSYDPAAIRKEIQDHKKLTAPQKSMLYARINDSANH